MRYLLDTCVISEFTKPTPNPGLDVWISQQEPTSLYLSALTIGELEQGIQRLPDGARRGMLHAKIFEHLLPEFHNRVLPVDEEVAVSWGRLAAAAIKRGKTPPMVDSLMAAIALTHGMIVVTRNIKNFEALEVPLLNPWT